MYLEKAIENIRQIDWKSYEKKIKKKVLLNDFLLIEEYLKRVAIFLKKIENIQYDDFNMHSDFILIMNNILKLSDDVRRKIKDTYNDLFLNIPNYYYYHNIFVFYIYISILIDEGKIEEEYFGIYDPLLKFFNNGGELGPGRREINLGSGIQIPFYDWYKNSINKELIDIDNLELEFKDIRND